MTSDPGPVLRAKLAVSRARIEARELRHHATAGVGGALGRLGRRVVLRLHRDEDVPLPDIVDVAGHRFDVVDDLVGYTGLPRPQVEELVHRRTDSFRAEWFLTPQEQRVDDWFYLSSSTYLFGNAVHDALPFLALLDRLGIEPGRALDYGGGTGNLALALAAVGWTVDYVERSALQKDFVSYRRDRHGLDVRVLHGWQPLERRTYDLICAIDVLEHVPALEELLTTSVLPALAPRGRLAESSPFVRNLSNPMHHEHQGLEELLAREGLAIETTERGARIWRLRGDDADQVATPQP